MKFFPADQPPKLVTESLLYTHSHVTRNFIGLTKEPLLPTDLLYTCRQGVGIAEKV
jgi:hypothetical protein